MTAKRQPETPNNRGAASNGKGRPVRGAAPAHRGPHAITTEQPSTPLHSSVEQPREARVLLPPYLNVSLDDIPGERWRFIEGYGEHYSVSDHGRVKSHARMALNGQRIKTRILKQTAGRQNNELTVKLCWEGEKKTHRVSSLVGNEFLGERESGQVYCRKNKDKRDNRLKNIIRVSYSESCEIDYQLGRKADWGIATLKEEEGQRYRRRNCTYEAGNLVSKICIKCNKDLPIEHYHSRVESGSTRRECRTCYLLARGVKDIGKLSQHMELAQAGLRQCWRCKEIKPLVSEYCKNRSHYLGRSHTCKACQKVINEHNRRQAKSKQQQANLTTPSPE